MEKIHEDMCFDVDFLYENIRTCSFACNFLCFQHFYPGGGGRGPLHHFPSVSNYRQLGGPLASLFLYLYMYLLPNLCFVWSMKKMLIFPAGSTPHVAFNAQNAKKKSLGVKPGNLQFPGSE